MDLLVKREDAAREEEAIATTGDENTLAMTLIRSGHEVKEETNLSPSARMPVAEEVCQETSDATMQASEAQPDLQKVEPDHNVDGATANSESGEVSATIEANDSKPSCANVKHRKRFNKLTEPPKPFACDILEPLRCFAHFLSFPAHPYAALLPCHYHRASRMLCCLRRSNLRTNELPEEPTLSLLHDAARLLHFYFKLPLSTPLTVALSATSEGGTSGDAGMRSKPMNVFSCISTAREDRRVRIIFSGPAAAKRSPAGEVEVKAATQIVDKLLPGRGPESCDVHEEASASQAEASSHEEADLVLNLPRKAKFATDSDSEAEIEAISKLPVHPVSETHTDGQASLSMPCPEASGTDVQASSKRACDDACESTEPSAAALVEGSCVGWCEDLQEVVNSFDTAISARRLRGIDAVLYCSNEVASEQCPPQLLQVGAIAVFTCFCCSSH